jgi:hypothetical protein
MRNPLLNSTKSLFDLLGVSKDPKHQIEMINEVLV